MAPCSALACAAGSSLSYFLKGAASNGLGLSPVVSFCPLPWRLIQSWLQPSALCWYLWSLIPKPWNALSPAFCAFIFFYFSGNITILPITMLENLESFLSIVPRVYQIFRITKYRKFPLSPHCLRLKSLVKSQLSHLFRLPTCTDSLLYFIQMTISNFPFCQQCLSSL